jgi:hypothetical protein
LEDQVLPFFWLLPFDMFSMGDYQELMLPLTKLSSITVKAQGEACHAYFIKSRRMVWEIERLKGY